MSTRVELKWDVAFPIEGYTPDDEIQSFPVNDVTFELNDANVFPDHDHRLEQKHINDIRILGVVRGVDGKDSSEIKDNAYRLVDRAVNLVQFPVFPGLRTVDEVYFRRRLDGPEIDNNFMIMSRVTKSFTIIKGNPQKIIEDKLKQLGAVRPDRKETLEKALSYYRIAVCASNPYQAIESFFGAIQAIVKEMRKKKSSTQIKEKEIKNYMKPIIISKTRGMTEDAFYQKFRYFWGKYRSDATHGEYHVNDYLLLKDARKAQDEVAKWTRIIIDDYAQKSI